MTLTNVAPLPTVFFGRTADIEKLERLANEGRRILTLLGPAGAGKTRLARRLCELHASSREGGAWFCDLTEARDLGGVLTAVGHALEVTLTKATEARALEALSSAIAARGSTMLVLDNCEQVVEAAARFASRVAEIAPNVTQIITSREALRIPGEQVHTVAPLDFEDAGRLFIDRARSVQPDFAPTAADDATLVEIVRRLDGLPLAIELAAARMGILTLEEIRKRLEERFMLLAAGPRFATERQRTMRGAIDWSWELLSPIEQMALARCAVFRGGFDLDAAREVLGRDDALDAVQSLALKSLIVVGERRYHLYDSIRAYAHEKLQEAKKEEETLDRHAAHYAKAGTSWAQDALMGQAAEPRKRLLDDLENMLGAHRHSLARALSGDKSAVAMTFALLRAMSELLKGRGPLDLMLQLLDATLDPALIAHANPTHVAEALRDRAMAQHFAPEAAASKIQDLTRALEIAQRTKDIPLELSCRSVFLSVELLHGQPDAARNHARIALERARSLGDPRAIAKAYADLGACDLAVGRVEEARASLKEAIALSEANGDLVETALNHARLGETLLQLGLMKEASEHAEKGIALAKPFDHQRLLAALSGVAGMIAYEQGDLEMARQRFEAAFDHAQRAGADLLQPFYRANRGAVLADSDDIEGATADVEAAEALVPRFADDPVLGATVAISRGHLDLAHARAADRIGDTAKALAARARAQSRLDTLKDDKRDFEDLRLMRRRFERMLAQASGNLAPTGTADDDANALVVADDGSWFRVPHGTRVDISQRASLRTLLLALTRHRLGASGEAMSLEAIVRNGWPGDRASSSSTANRARVALTRLRQLGLGDILIAKKGYLLDPDVPVIIARPM